MSETSSQSPNKVNVCLIGHKFMGRTHSNAYLKVNKFFTDLPVEPVMHTIVGRNQEELKQFAAQWGWKNTSTDWRKAITDPEVGLVDIGTPNNMHAEMSIAAIEAGKNVACEKPLAGTLAEARQMRDAAKAGKGKTFVWYNYRRVPAVALAYEFARAGKLGRIYHVRAYYLQDWAGPGVPLIWRFQKAVSGSGSHGDLNAHVIDMARFITGQEIDEVVGAISETFIKEREIPAQGSSGGIAAAPRPPAGKWARATWTTPFCSWRGSPAGAWPASKPHARPPATRTRTASRSTATRAPSVSISRT